MAIKFKNFNPGALQKNIRRAKVCKITLAEFDIFKQIRSIATNKMVILITHRLYNLKIADYLYVMQDGKIAEEGTFNDLIEKKGVFAQLYNMQQL